MNRGEMIRELCALGQAREAQRARIRALWAEAEAGATPERLARIRQLIDDATDSLTRNGERLDQLRRELNMID